jgi:hypothetical protein
MATTVAPKQPSIWEDFVDIFVSPAQVFTRRQGRGFFVALAVLTVVFAALAVGTKPIMQPVYDVALEQQAELALKQNPQLTPEQLAKGRSIGEKVATIGAVISIPIMVLATGLVLLLVGKLFDSQLTAGDAMMVATYASFPKILAMVASALIVLVMDPSSITSMYSATLGLGRFIDPTETPVLAALLGRVDLFTIWVTVLLGVGLHVAGKVPKGQAAIAAAIVWLIGALPGVLGAMRQG